MVHGTVREMVFFLEPPDEVTQFSPGNILRGFLENIREISEIRADISGIRFDGVVCKATKGDHLPELF